MSIIVSPSFSLQPNKLVLFNRFDKVTNSPDWPMTNQKHPNNYEVVSPIVIRPGKITRAFHNFKISDNAYRNLRTKINWLFYLSRKKDITTYSGRRIFSFRCAFVTFTLPSKQQKPTNSITKDLFNHLLTVLRDRYGLKNYVWRLEYQKNGNVHYHLVTDSYIDYHALLRVWNKILDTNGYIAPYAAKHDAMSLQDYIGQYSQGDKSQFVALKKRYFKGKAAGWQNPNTVDVKSVVSKSKIAAYVAKYFGKSPDPARKCHPLDNEENSKSLRLWFCSRGLSKLKTISDYLAHVDFSPETIVRYCKGFRRVAVKYATLYFFDISKMSGWSRKFLSMLYANYAKKQGYIPV